MFLPEKFSPTPSKDAVYFGIDLGTTYTLVATIDSSEVDIQNLSKIPVKFISYAQKSPLEHGGEIVEERVASIIAMYNGKPYCGSKLYELKGNQDFIKNQNIFYHWKLDLGIDRHPLYPDSVLPELDTPAKVAGKVLNFCRQSYTKNKETKLNNVVITVPASFQMNQRKDVIEAASLAKIELDNQMLIDEPNAAFIGHFNGLSQQFKSQFLTKGSRTKRVLIFDIGGGTCDLSIIEVGYNSSMGLLIANKAISRYNDLGGQDIDYIIAEEILYPFFLKQFDLKDEMAFKDLSESILPQLATIGEKLKIGICNIIGARFVQKAPLEEELKAVVFTIENRSIRYGFSDFNFPPLSITGFQFQEIINKVFQAKGYSLKYQDKYIRSVNETINDIMEKADLNKQEIDVVLPVGGSSANPILLNKLKEIFPASDFWIPAKPDMLVAEGAAIYSFFYYRFGKSLINPICSETVGIETKGKAFFPLIEKGSPLPITVSLPNFKTQSSFQDEFIVPICLNDINHIVQEIRIPLDRMYTGNEVITINAELDSNKVLSLEIFIDDERLLDYTLENPFFFGALSKEQVKFVKLSYELDAARRSKDNNKQKSLIINLLSQYFDIKNYHELARLSEEYLKKFDADNPVVLNYAYIGNKYLGRLEAAKKALEKAIEVSPHSSAYRFNYSLLVEDLEGREKALEYLYSIPENHQHDETVRCRMVDLKNSLGLEATEEAIKICENYENAPWSFSDFTIKSFLPKIFRIAGKPFHVPQLEGDTSRDQKVLVAASTPKPIV
jgi:molecular chaperone DnaK